MRRSHVGHAQGRRHWPCRFTREKFLSRKESGGEVDVGSATITSRRGAARGDTPRRGIEGSRPGGTRPGQVRMVVSKK